MVKQAAFTLLTLTLISSGMILGSKQSWSVAVHPGKVVDWDSEKALEKVWVTAYESRELETSGECPSFKGKITADQTTSGGEFSLEIPLRVPDYYVQYCLEGYGGRRSHLRNEPLGHRIEPYPVKILKKEGASEADQTRRVSQIVQDLDQRRINRHITNEELAYLREVDSDGYDSALAKNAVLLSRVRDSGGPYPIVVAERKRTSNGWLSSLSQAFQAVRTFFNRP
jgi:hypothetical protein